MIEPSDYQAWQNILLREWYHCADDDYAGRLRKLIGLPNDAMNERALAETERPYTFEIEAALRQGCRVRKAKYGWDKRLRRFDQAKKQIISLEELLEQLREHHWFDRFVAHHLLVPYSSEAIEPLHELVERRWTTLRETGLWLLRSIGAETTDRLAANADQLICPTCVVHCASREITLSNYPTITYYGCRACGQSLTFQSRPDKIIAVLNEGMVETQVRLDHALRVNWLKHGRLFDFDSVEIIRATDEAVERFAVRVGNDIDPFRDPRYNHMQCLIDPACKLSENTPRVLEQVFGLVEWGKV